MAVQVLLPLKAEVTVYWHWVVRPLLVGVVVAEHVLALAKAEVTTVWHCVVRPLLSAVVVAVQLGTPT